MSSGSGIIYWAEKQRKELNGVFGGKKERMNELIN